MNEFFKKNDRQYILTRRTVFEILFKNRWNYFFYFQITKLIDDDKTTIWIIIHATQIFNDIFDNSVWIFEFFTKTKFKTT